VLMFHIAILFSTLALYFVPHIVPQAFLITRKSNY